MSLKIDHKCFHFFRTACENDSVRFEIVIGRRIHQVSSEDIMLSMQDGMETSNVV